MASARHITTEELLVKVSDFLTALSVEFGSQKDVKLRKFFAKAATELGDRVPNKSSLLFASLHVLLKDIFNCVATSKPPYENCSWPCVTNYVNERYGYTYWNSTFEVSILEERSSAEEEFLYILFELPSEKLAYFVLPIKTNLVPQLKGGDTTNVFKFREIYSMLLKVINKFITPFTVSRAKGMKFRSRDYSSHGVKPDLSIVRLCPPPKKRLKLDLAQEKALDECSDYVRLKTIFDREVNPTRAATLLGVIYNFCIVVYGCKPSCNPDKWPCPATYQSQVMELEIPTGELRENENGEQEMVHLALNSIKLKKTSCQKIVPELIPTFSSDDEAMDQRRIEVLALFLDSVFEKFVYKIIKGTFRSLLSSSETSIASSSHESLEEDDDQNG